MEAATNMIKLNDKQPIYLELYEALAHFIGRQQIVVRAVIEQGVSPAALVRGVAAWHDKTPQIGAWGEDWEFFFHGGGCELRHRETGEPINWNGPDPLAFGTLSFIHHLEWRLAYEGGLTRLRAYIGDHDLLSVIDLIDELIAEGVITPDRHLGSEYGASQQHAA
jgi:hypothetical protein